MFLCLKSGVIPTGLKSECLLGILLAAAVFEAAGQKFTVTSLTDGKHMENSLHYYGLAFDIRIRDLKNFGANKMALLLSEALGECYTVILESDHIHVEYSK